MPYLSIKPSLYYTSIPLTIRGPSETAFAGGVFHGRILLPPDYPFKPPNIVFLTKNGRFEVGSKICLSISAYHEETWQPAWGVRTMLEALISFLPSEGKGAIGALDWAAEERKKLAKEV
jgi:ubiquitin-conjugating enzyme E2 J1